MKNFARIFVFVFCLFGKNAFALPFLPMNFLLKPYVTIDSFVWTKFGNYNTGMPSGFDRFYNLSVGAGLRIHKFFGVEAGYSQFIDIALSGGDLVKKDIFKSKNFYGDLLVYVPFFDIIGNAVELYGSAGIVMMDARFGTFSDKIWAPKFGAGLQARIMGMSSARIGFEYYKLNFSGPGIIDLNNIMLVKVGATMYFL